MSADTRLLTSRAGTLVVLKRELRALLSDKQAIYMTILFGLGFPFLLSRDTGEGVEGVMVLLIQVSTFPFIGSFQTAISAFVAEREKGTLGPLLATPLPNASIFSGKLLGSYVPGVATAAVSISIFLATLPSDGRVALARVPGAVVLEAVALSWVTGLLLCVFGTLIGSRAKTLRGAQLFSSVVLAPVFIGMFLLGATLFENQTLGLFILVGLTMVCVPIIAAAARVWRREEILTKT